MNVLILAASGRLAPHVIKALEGEHTLRLTDIKIDPQSDHEFLKVDISDPDQVMSASKGMDAIINLSVQRNDQAFNVNARGCYNMMVSAVHHRIRRVINTGPHFTIAGATYETFDYLLSPFSKSRFWKNEKRPFLHCAFLSQNWVKSGQNRPK